MPPLEFLDRQNEEWALLRKQNGGPGRALAIFVHGFLGNYLTTWGQLPKLLSNHAPTEPALDPWDFLFLGYSTRKIDSYLPIAHMIASHWERAAAGRPPFLGPYSKLALFGHSLGTLGIRQLLCAAKLHPANMLASLHSVTLFGTPINGSPLASWGGSLAGGDIAKALEPGNPQLRMLRTWNESVYPSQPWVGVRVILGADDQVVGHTHADLIDFSGDSKPLLLNFDHSSLVKPTSWDKSTIRDEIVGALQ